MLVPLALALFAVQEAPAPAPAARPAVQDPADAAATPAAELAALLAAEAKRAAVFEGTIEREDPPGNELAGIMVMGNANPKGTPVTGPLEVVFGENGERLVRTTKLVGGFAVYDAGLIHLLMSMDASAPLDARPAAGDLSRLCDLWGLGRALLEVDVKRSAASGGNYVTLWGTLPGSFIDGAAHRPWPSRDPVETITVEVVVDTNTTRMKQIRCSIERLSGEQSFKVVDGKAVRLEGDERARAATWIYTLNATDLEPSKRSQLVLAMMRDAAKDA